MILYIAEKPSLGRAVADALPKPHKKGDGFITVANGDVVSWCIGHLLEQAQPERYDERFKKWQMEDQNNRTLVIVRPTVVFGEGNRGNVYNLFKQIASRKFLMIGNGKNIKSMAYVENVAAFLEFSLRLNHGVNIYNYVDKPDFDMNKLVSLVRNKLFGKKNVGIRLPVAFAIIIGFFADILSKITGKSLPVSSIRIKKFLSFTQFETSVKKIKFSPPVKLEQGLNRTLNYEFIEDNSKERTFITE